MPNPTSTPLAVVQGQAVNQGAATEVTLAGFPAKAIIRRVRFLLTAGSGATIAPALCKDTGGIGGLDQILVAAAAAEIDVADLYIPFESLDDGTIVLTPQCDAGADNTVQYAIWYTT